MTTSGALVIGGTGMLRKASVAIARKFSAFTAVAGTRASLHALAQDIGDLNAHQQYYLDLDWDDQDKFLAALSRHLSKCDPPSLVVAWVHNPSLGPRIANALTTPRYTCEFFQILGSAGRGPTSQAAALKNQVNRRADLTYHQVILGFRRDGGHSRWLTNDEISEGVLDAISAKLPTYVIGTVTPWSERPDAA
jgi:hypothetical protein